MNKDYENLADRRDRNTGTRPDEKQMLADLEFVLEAFDRDFDYTRDFERVVAAGS